jgi:hypothetical protein
MATFNSYVKLPGGNRGCNFLMMGYKENDMIVIQ